MTPEQYEKNKALLADPAVVAKTPPTRLAQVQTAIAEYEAGQGGDASLEHAPPAAMGDDLKSMLDPMTPVVPQVLATSPTTTHLKGDEDAKEEWLRGDLSNPNGVVIVYETPMAQVRKDFAENPNVLGATSGHTISPGANIEKGSSTEQAYQDYRWRQAADAAAKAGKTAYRYSRAPWVTGGKNAGILDTLSTKVKNSVLPAIEGATAFVMGVDDTANFGVANSLSDSGLLDDSPPKLTPEEEASGKYAYHPTLGRIPKSWEKKTATGGIPIGGGNDEAVGGVSATAQKSGASTLESNDMLREEYPKARTAGQIAGIVDPAFAGKVAGKAVGKVAGKVTKVAKEVGEAGVKAAKEAVEQRVGQRVEKGIAQLEHWNPANSLWEWVMGAYTPKNVLGEAALGVAKSGVAGGVSHGVGEAARAGANYAATGESGTTWGEAGGRALDAAKSSAMTSVPFAGARLGGHWVREGARYEGIPGEVEALNGGRVYPITGHATPKHLKEARAEGRGREVPVDPTGVLIQQVRKPIFNAAKGHVTDINRAVSERNAPFLASPEGRARLPYTNLVQTALDKTRERMSKSGGEMRSVGVPNAERNPKGILNTNIEGVSVTPRKGWIPVAADEVDGLLSASNKARTLRAARNPARPAKRSRAALARTPPRAAPGRPSRPGVSITAPNAAWRDAPGALDRRGYQANRPRQLPAGEQQALAKLDPGGPIVPRSSALSARTRPMGPKDGIPDAEFTQNIPDAEFTERRGQAPRPQRPGKQPLPRGVKQTLGQELRQRGIKTVYVAPRRYSAKHGESATKQLLRKGADTPNDRDMRELHYASLKDRDERTLKGEKGGWSKQQTENAKAVDAAKDTRARAAGNKPSDVDAKVLKFAHRSEGDAEDVAAMVDTAKRAGGDTLDKVKAARVAHSLSKLQSIGGFGREGGRWLLGANNLFDAGVLRLAYPAARALEKGGKKSARVSEIGVSDEEAARRKARVDAHRKKAEPKGDKKVRVRKEVIKVRKRKDDK